MKNEIKFQSLAEDTFLFCGGVSKVRIEIKPRLLTIILEGEYNNTNNRTIKDFFVELERDYKIPVLDIDLYSVASNNNELHISMQLQS